ncbi:aspartyl/glutamyl-tRNA(Asn/Gln) amidotransferase subunit C [Gottschalkia purinilytica]|uniref:Aspartyl/glutamyl-tRNA(Asn/Gln) amidotransferase subunit C n=1 Tax=Gottschalkia purinilytica TaxID=1503 RepID=A0A0L0W6Z0_GOTPU|nr:Asp-tRNA(Asn)/Glu-tRNA(Gln) amidotransferase subunit GatC [Gottschalkia purinilytica]KNF07246.1 aspartyl/glutamyl-tRNA(Asn/Gln) amidotransferase subunit C [Gottschalkia purinilytica]
MTITEEEIEKVIKLSKLEIKGKEKEKFIKDIEILLNYVEKIEEMNTTNIEPTYYIHSQMNVTREDVLKESMDKNKALMNAKDTLDDYFKISTK